MRSITIAYLVGVGFSHGTLNVTGAKQAAQAVWNMLQIFFSDPTFSKFAENEFAIWTESYVLTCFPFYTTVQSYPGTADTTDLPLHRFSYRRMQRLGRYRQRHGFKLEDLGDWERTHRKSQQLRNITDAAQKLFRTGSTFAIPRVHDICIVEPISSDGIE